MVTRVGEVQSTMLQSSVPEVLNLGAAKLSRGCRRRKYCRYFPAPMSQSIPPLNSRKTLEIAASAVIQDISACSAAPVVWNDSLRASCNVFGSGSSILEFCDVLLASLKHHICLCSLRQFKRIWMNCHDVIIVGSRQLENHLWVSRASRSHPEGIRRSKKVANHCSIPHGYGRNRRLLTVLPALHVYGSPQGSRKFFSYAGSGDPILGGGSRNRERP